MPIVSAVIPTRGRPSLVCRAVRSVLEQTVQDMEAIVIIDGIDAGSQSALREIDDPRLRVIALEQSVGGSEARNIGARHAQSPWIALLDDDDTWLPNKIEVQLARAESLRHKMVLVSCSYVLRSRDTEQVWPIRPIKLSEPLSEYFFCTSRNLFQTSTLMCSKALLLRHPFRKGLKRLQDWDWLLRVAADEEVVVVSVPDVLSIYNVQGDVNTVSRALDWEGSYKWGRDNRHLMTTRAYSHFIAKKCAPEASQQRVGIRVVPLLLACLVTAGPRFDALFKFAIYYLLTTDQRRRLGDVLMRFRGQTTRACPI